MALSRMWWFGAAFGVLVGVGGCSDDDSTCALGTTGRQPVHRFPSGSTFTLPALAADGACGSARWELVESPAGETNVVVDAADGARFTPVEPGDYRFRVAATGEEQRLTVVDGATVPFHQLNYYPGHSIARVGDEIWTANVYAPTITPIASDDTAGEPIRVGAWPVAIAWRDGMELAVVAQRASDDLGLVDVARQRIVDAIWVGDEPADVVVAPDGDTAYVALAVSGVIVEVDLEARVVTRRIELVPDIRALALSPDGDRLYAARLRSGQPEREPFPDTPVADERDLFVIDTRTGEIERELIDVGGTLRALEVSADGASLYLVRLRNETRGNIADGVAHFLDEVVRIDAIRGDVLAVADLGRQPSSGGRAVSLQGLALTRDRLWVAAEASDVAVALDPITLVELDRAPAAGRPRGVAVRDDRVYVHGTQGFVVTPLDGDGAIRTGDDPRPASVARGQAIFTGPGEGYGDDHACNSCHAEGVTDGLVWKVGPVDEYATPRPLFWLEGTYPLGWPAYLSDVRNWGYEGGSTIGVRPTTEEAEDLGDYLASIMPPPAANDLTLRDGSHSEAGLRGKALFEGPAGCVFCHRGPLFTTRDYFDDGVTPGPSDVPSLVGAYRHGVWLKDGSAGSLRDAVVAVADWIDAELDDAAVDDLTRYVGELTARDFFLLASAPRDDDEQIAIDRPIELTFSYPVWADPTNLARIHLVDGAGAAVDATLAADGRHVTITPADLLDPGAEYRVVIDGDFESFDEQRAIATELTLGTAAAPALTLDGAYRWSFDTPTFDPTTGEFDEDVRATIEVAMTATATPSGAELTFDLGQGLTYTRHAVIDGAQLILPALPVPVGPSLADTTLDPGTLIDDDGDGRADRVEGTLTFNGPGFRFTELPWRVRPPAAKCEEGASGGVEVEISAEADDAPVITWGGVDGAIAVYVTAPDATIPQGPGSVEGTAYWVIQTASFPTPFPSPVTYGVVPAGAVDVTADSGGTFEPLASGTCYKVTVTTSGFAIGTRIVRWP